LLIDSTFEVWRKLPEVFLELSGCLESKAHGTRGVLWQIPDKA
jgi:hypothetical protein